MRVGFLLNLYQPITQEPDVFHKVYSECYSPLLKLLKSSKYLNVTLNMPLSFLQQMDHYGYSDWIHGIKELVNQGRVEIVGSGAYHPILPLLDEEYASQQIVLQEYSLGYYFGKHTGFEGEKSMMLRDLDGFFPPEMAISSDLVKQLDEFGYKWVLVEDSSLYEYKKSHHKGANHFSQVLNVKGMDIKAVVRDTDLSNLISFKTDTDTSAIINYVTSKHQDSLIVCMDGEFFGHHNKRGLFLLDFLIQEFTSRDIALVKIGDIVNDTEAEETVTLNASSWAATDVEIEEGTPYPIWEIKANNIHKHLWHLLHLICDEYSGFFESKNTFDDFEVVPVWKPKELNHIQSESERASISQNLLVNNFLNSDQFWWSSKKTINNSLYLYQPAMVLKSLAIATDLANMSKNEAFSSKALQLIEEIKSLL